MKLIGSLFLSCLAGVCLAESSDDLYDEVYSLDTKFFDAFNRCDIKTMEGFFSKDLEFYHDIVGVSGFESTMKATKSNCDSNLGLTRTLVKPSLEVYPIKDYGAIQKGKHTFCHIENGKNDCGTFEFVHIWKKTESGWQMERVISYGH